MLEGYWDNRTPLMGTIILTRPGMDTSGTSNKSAFSCNLPRKLMNMYAMSE
jgi:hypothetical protein